MEGAPRRGEKASSRVIGRSGNSTAGNLPAVAASLKHAHRLVVHAATTEGSSAARDSRPAPIKNSLTAPVPGTDRPISLPPRHDVGAACGSSRQNENCWRPCAHAARARHGAGCPVAHFIRYLTSPTILTSMPAIQPRTANAAPQPGCEIAKPRLTCPHGFVTLPRSGTSLPRATWEDIWKAAMARHGVACRSGAAPDVGR